MRLGPQPSQLDAPTEGEVRVVRELDDDPAARREVLADAGRVDVRADCFLAYLDLAT